MSKNMFKCWLGSSAVLTSIGYHVENNEPNNNLRMKKIFLNYTMFAIPTMILYTPMYIMYQPKIDNYINCKL